MTVFPRLTLRAGLSVAVLLGVVLLRWKWNHGGHGEHGGRAGR